MQGQLIPMAFLGVVAFVGLSILGVPLALPLALLTAVLTVIPNVGPIIAMAAPALLAFAEDPKRALYVVIFYTILQTVEGYLITPMAQQKVISLPSALLLTSQVLLAVLFGFYGLALAAPLTAVLMVLVKELYVEDVLQDPVETLDSKH
jgi:predicted PurR-regulated permease PerM